MSCCLLGLWGCGLGPFDSFRVPGMSNYFDGTGVRVRWADEEPEHLAQLEQPLVEVGFVFVRRALVVLVVVSDIGSMFVVRC